MYVNKTGKKTLLACRDKNSPLFIECNRLNSTLPPSPSLLFIEEFTVSGTSSCKTGQSPQTAVFNLLQEKAVKQLSWALAPGLSDLPSSLWKWERERLSWRWAPGFEMLVVSGIRTTCVFSLGTSVKTASLLIWWVSDRQWWVKCNGFASYINIRILSRSRGFTEKSRLNTRCRCWLTLLSVNFILSPGLCKETQRRKKKTLSKYAKFWKFSSFNNWFRERFFFFVCIPEAVFFWRTFDNGQKIEWWRGTNVNLLMFGVCKEDNFCTLVSAWEKTLVPLKPTYLSLVLWCNRLFSPLAFIWIL